MNKWLRFIAFVPLSILSLSSDLMLPNDCSASYLIELKTGTTFTTDQYWEEDGQIKFNHYGGMMGVSKDMIASVTSSDAPVPKEIIGREPTEGSDLPAAIENPQNFEEKVSQYQESLAQYQNDIDAQTEKFNSAKENKNQKSMDEAWDNLKILNSEKERLRKEVMELYNNKMPEWWGEVTGEEM